MVFHMSVTEKCPLFPLFLVSGPFPSCLDLCKAPAFPSLDLWEKYALARNGFRPATSITSKCSLSACDLTGHLLAPRPRTHIHTHAPSTSERPNSLFFIFLLCLSLLSFPLLSSSHSYFLMFFCCCSICLLEDRPV